MAATLSFHYVAFIDILGFSEMVTSDCNGPPSKATCLPRLLIAHKTANEHACSLTGAKITQFSDSIVLAVPYVVDHFVSVVEHVASLQRALLNQQVLSRGGLSYGKHFSTEEFIFSEALIKAYNIERDRAIFPRVVIDDDLLDLIDPVEFNVRPTLIHEADGACFVDYIREMAAEEAHAAISATTAGWEKKTIRVREKLRWLRDYAAFTFPNGEEFKSERFIRA